jgi:ribosomal protein S4
MSWNKYNVYNMANYQPVTFGRYKNLFALRLLYKRAARKYHGQGLSERIFKTQLYSPRINVVALAAGTQPKGDDRLKIWSGLFQGVERRLDTVIFRSLFASSIRQARQMVIHGHVELNGKIVCPLRRQRMGIDN